MLKSTLIIGIGLLCLWAGILPVNAGLAVADKGVLDLRQESLGPESIYKLDGEWEFFWEELLTPDSYADAREKGKQILVSVPSYWESYEVAGTTLGGEGYGTYALQILLPENYRSGICIDIPVFDVASRFYLNKRLINRNGKVGTSREEEKPWYEPSRFCYVPDTDTLQILIQVSNFHHRRGGYWQTVHLGGTEKVLDRAEHRRMYSYSTIGVLFFFTVFFLIFWIVDKREPHMLLFALTALGILIRSVNTGLYFSNAFIETPWTWQIRMEYFGTYLAYLCGMLFLHRMFPRAYMKPVIKGNNILFALLIFSVFVLPPRLFTYGMLVFQPLIVLFLIHYLLVSLIGAFRRRIMDVIFFLSLLLFIFTLVNDVLLANSAGSVSNNYLSQISFQIFILAMAVLIIIQWVANYKVRLELESSLRFKNQVLSVIAHDLKNPVASIAQFSDLLATKPELAGKQEFLDSLNESSQAAVTLLDNLLYWGRVQSDDLKTNPVPLDLDKLVCEVQALYAYMAQQKGVQVRTEIAAGLSLRADRSLVTIMIRNLVSNALKFTPSGGEVRVKAWAKKDQVCLSVSDTGVGIKEENLQVLQHEGSMQSTQGTDKEAGTGLGLRLVHELMDRCGGKLEIESTAGVGSSFTISLPSEYKERKYDHT